jgi:hypothetical protein
MHGLLEDTYPNPYVTHMNVEIAHVLRATTREVKGDGIRKINRGVEYDQSIIYAYIEMA